MSLERIAVLGDAGSTTNALPSSRAAPADLCLLPLSQVSSYPCPLETKKRPIVRASGAEFDSENPAAAVIDSSRGQMVGGATKTPCG